MLLLIIIILLNLSIVIFTQYQRHQKAKKIYYRAFKLVLKGINYPYNNINDLYQALWLYQKCSDLVKNKRYREAIKSCQKIIDNYQKFIDYITLARKQFEQKQFKEALANFLKADATICFTNYSEAEITECRSRISQQNAYEQALKQSFAIAKSGKFKKAIAIIEPELAKFDRDDGTQFLAKLKRICAAKECYRLGLLAEKNGIIENAIKQYQEALQILPELTECKIRLAIVSIKTSNPTQAISYLQDINNYQASYFRGFAYMQLCDWQQANREWHFMDRVNVDIWRSKLKKISDFNRLSSIKKIEKLVDNGQLEIAKTVSLEFRQKFGSEPKIEHNFKNYIQPILERQVWHTKNWQQIAYQNELTWLENQDIESLHNWAIATYYQAQINPNKLIEFIIAWSTALANIKSNTILQNVPWLGSNTVDIENVSNKLKQILENAIDPAKYNNINEYLNFQDVYRREMLALSFVERDNCGVRIKQKLFILPGCYQRFSNYLPKIDFPAKIWSALYTDYGLAVAAYHEGDISRAIKIKPGKKPVSKADCFAYSFISH